MWNVIFVPWTFTYQEAIEIKERKSGLSEAVMKICPTFDAPFVIYSDAASYQELFCVLNQ